MSDSWEPFDSQHMASRGRAMMRGHRQLVGVTMVERSKVGVEGVRDVGQSPSSPPDNQPPESIALPIYHPPSFVGSATVAG